MEEEDTNGKEPVAVAETSLTSFNGIDNEEESDEHTSKIEELKAKQSSEPSEFAHQTSQDEAEEEAEAKNGHEEPAVETTN